MVKGRDWQVCCICRIPGLGHTAASHNSWNISAPFAQSLVSTAISLYPVFLSLRLNHSLNAWVFSIPA